MENLKNESSFSASSSFKSSAAKTTKGKMLKSLKLANPFRAKENFVEMFVESVTRNNTVYRDTKPSFWHTKRSFAEVPLTAEGVADLQKDRRISRKSAIVPGALTGATVGAGVGLAITFTCAPAWSPLMGLSLGLPIVGGTLIGAVAGASLGLPLGSDPERIRTHGLYYTGIVESKKLSRKTTQEVLNNDATEKRAPGSVSSILQEMVKKGEISLSPAQISDIESFYKFAYDSQIHA